jgi:hypothetical protein
MRRILGFFVFTIISNLGIVNAQFFVTGQDDAWTDWRQIDNEKYKIVFPVSSYEQANYIANIFDFLIEKHGSNSRIRKFTVLIHGKSSLSNGMVAVAPYRMELYPMQKPDESIQNRLEGLAIHEFKHIVQMNNLQNGVGRIAKFLFGEQAIGLMAGLYVPAWFLEGEAVCQETQMSDWGRGRSPYFIDQMKAIVLSGKKYTYDKFVCGSYKDFVPNHYNLGYHMVSQAKIFTKNDAVWDSVLNRTVKGLAVRSFSRAIGKYVFKDSPKYASSVLYNMVLDSLSSLYSSDKTKDYYQSRIRTTDKYYTDYTNPVFVNDSIIYSLKNGLESTNQIVEINLRNSSQKNICNIGYSSESRFSYSNNWFVWDERRQDLLWEHSVRNIIVCYDSERNKKYSIVSNLNLFSPKLDKTARFITAVSIDQAGNSALVLIDRKSGELIKTYKIQNMNQLIHPVFGENQRFVYVICGDGRKKDIVKVDFDKMSHTILYSTSKIDVFDLFYSKNRVFMTANVGGGSELVMLEDKKLKRLTDSKYSSKHPSFNSENMIFSSYTENGFKLFRIKEYEFVNKLVEKPNPFLIASRLKQDDIFKNIVAKSNFSRYKSSKFSRLKNSLNIHSWAPVYINSFENNADIGVSVSSQNIMNTLFANVGYRKGGDNYPNGEFVANISYRRFFPVLETEFKYANAELHYNIPIEGGILQEPRNLKLYRKYADLRWESDLLFPFNLSKGLNTTILKPSLGYEFRRIENLELSQNITGVRLKDSRFYNKYSYLNIAKANLQFYNISKTYKRSFDYNYAQFINLGYYHSLEGDYDYGNSYYASINLIFPGFHLTNSVKLYLAYQNWSIANSPLSTRIRNSRGMNLYNSDEMITASFDYGLPIAYPDKSIGSLVYIKRVKLAAFADKTWISYNYNGVRKEYDWYSTGLELTGDVNFFRLRYPVNIGFRAGYENQNKSTFYNIIFNISFQ